MSISRVCDTVLDAVVLLLATWTVTYHVCLVAGLPVSVSVVLESALVAAAVVLGRSRVLEAQPAPGRRRGWRAAAARSAPSGARRTPGPSRAAGLASTLAAGLAVLAALTMAAGLPWVTVWVPFLLAAGLGVVAASLRLDRGGATPDAPTGEGRATGIVVLGWGLALAALSTVVLRPNPDDLYYVNLSQYVAQNGVFPARDTIYADQVWPMSNFPPTASYDPLVGVVAHPALGARRDDRLRRRAAAGDVPGRSRTVAAAACLGRPARRRGAERRADLPARRRHLLLRLPREPVPDPAVAGEGHPALPGRPAAARPRPGPTARTRRGGGRRGFFLTGVAAVACSTTALFVTPVIALAAAAPLALSGRRREAAVLAGAVAAYPLGGAVVTLGLGGRSADEFGIRRLYRFDPSYFGEQTFLTGVVGLVAVAAVLLGFRLVPHPLARVTTAILVLATAVTYVPGFTRLTFDTVGLGPTLWRISWGCTVAALVGVTTVRAGAWLAARDRAAAGHGPPRAVLLAAAAVVAVLTAGGHPIWSGETSASFAAPLQWKRGESTRSVTGWILDHTTTGPVLAPDALAITVAVTTAEVHTVAPRDYYLDYLRGVEGFDYRDRRRLVDFANRTRPVDASALDRSLRRLEVRVVCLDAADVGGNVAVLGLGWRTDLVTADYRCLLPPPSVPS